MVFEVVGGRAGVFQNTAEGTWEQGRQRGRSSRREGPGWPKLAAGDRENRKARSDKDRGSTAAFWV